MSVAISAPGKVILCGEHAVVHGKTAIALSLGLRTYVLATERDDAAPATVHLDLPDVDINETWAIDTLDGLRRDVFGDAGEDTSVTPAMRDKIERFAGYDGTSRSLAKVSFLYLYTALLLSSGHRKGLRVNVESTLPIGAGLGSSASFGTALAAALLVLRERHTTGSADATAPAERINHWAFRSEQLVHGNPSGLDNTMSTYGGALSFRSGQVQRLDRAPTLRFLLTNTRVERSTRVLVARVREHLDKFPGVIGPVLDAINGVSAQILELFQRHQDDPSSTELLHALETLMGVNHHLLNAIGVGHEALDAICRTTVKHGLVSKLTGAGGGGCAITLVRPSTSDEAVRAVKDALEALGFACTETEVAGPGVQEHVAPADGTLAKKLAWRVARSFA